MQITNLLIEKYDILETENTVKVMKAIRLNGIHIFIEEKRS